MTYRLTRRDVVATLIAAAVLPVMAVSRSLAADSAATLHDVRIKGLAFDPIRLHVSVGDSIRWTNVDLSPHTATAEDSSWDSGPIEEGQSIVLPVTAGMAAKYRCAFHPSMLAELVITGQ